VLVGKGLSETRITDKIDAHRRLAEALFDLLQTA
jgi:hypothetical protein